MPEAKLPSKIMISQIVHDIELTDNMNVDGRVGEYSRRRSSIRIKPRQRNELEILIHEVLHGIFASYNLRDQVRRLGIQPREMEEFVVGKLAKGLAQVLKDNPELTRYIGATCG